MSAGVDPERIEEALEVSLEQFASLVSGKLQISNDELQRAKDYLTGKMLVIIETPMAGCI